MAPVGVLIVSYPKITSVGVLKENTDDCWPSIVNMCLMVFPWIMLAFNGGLMKTVDLWWCCWLHLMVF